VLAAERDVMADELANTREIGAVPRLSGPPMRQTVGPAPGGARRGRTRRQGPQARLCVAGIERRDRSPTRQLAAR
jgi:hypothetical protein